MLLIIIEDITQRHEDMNSIFDWWKQYFLMKEFSECHNSAVHHGAHRILCHLYGGKILHLFLWRNRSTLISCLEKVPLWAHSNWHRLIWCCHHNWGAQCGATSEYPHHLLQYFEKHRIQWNFSFGTPIFRGHKILSWKNIHIIFVFVTPVEGTSLIREKGHFFWVLKPGFNLHKMWLTTKITDKF